jgi:hypothetical protein
MNKQTSKSYSKVSLQKIARADKGHPAKQLIVLSAVVLLACGLYAVGLKVLFVPVLIAVSSWRLPLPRIFTSWFSKAFVSLFVLAGVIQIASTLQFLALPHTGFALLAAIVTILYITIFTLAPKNSNGKTTVISATDVCALVVVIGFLLPFTPILAGDHSLLKIADIATVQGSDGVRHYISIENFMRYQHISYSRGNYYPSGFYEVAAFVQGTIFHSQFGLGLKNSAFLYFGDYLMYGSMLGFILYYLCVYWLRMFKERLAPEGWSWPKFLLALCLAPTLALLYLLPFVSEAFLSYYYVCVTIVCAFLFLTELNQTLRSNEDSVNLAVNQEGRWWLLVYLILVYGASMTWPLLIPPLLVIGALFLVPGRLAWRPLRDRLVSVSAIPIVIAFALQIIPIYFQIKYSVTNTSQSINATGGLTGFHAEILFLGVVLVVAALITTRLEVAQKRYVANIFLPLFAFLCLLMLYQYFTVGAVIYYVIKTSLLLEMMLLTFGVAMLIAAFAQSKLFGLRYAWALPLLPLLVVLLLINSIGNPLKDDRDLFRIRSNAPLPDFYSQDSQTYVNLGAEGKLKHYNMTSLHYNPAQGKFYANMQGPYWIGALQYDASSQDKQSFDCIGSVYYNLSFGDFSAIDQQQLGQNIKECASEAKSHGNTFYVITDPGSMQQVQNFVGNQVVVVAD